MTLADIQAAASRIQDRVLRTPCPKSIPLSEITGCQIYCKLDYLQRTGSFKERGACNTLLQLTAEQRQRGVIAASAGNHGLGLAYHSQLLGIPATVVMPVSAPLTKLKQCEQFLARIILHGANIEEARLKAIELCQAESLTYINGYNDPQVIAGQGTMALEIFEQVPDLDAIIVPIGGAGLVAGISVALKSLNPSVQIYGVEPENAASFFAAQHAGRPVMIPMQPTLADGLAVPQVGDLAFDLARRHLEKTVLVRERFIALAVLRLIELEKAVVEGGGAASLAALLQGLLPSLKGKKVVLPLCGGNIDTNMLGRVMERGLAADGRLCRFTAVISDRPGGLSIFTALIAAENASIKDISHDRAFASDDLSTVTVHCVAETRDFDHIHRLRDRLVRENFVVTFPDLE